MKKTCDLLSFSKFKFKENINFQYRMFFLNFITLTKEDNIKNKWDFAT